MKWVTMTKMKCYLEQMRVGVTDLEDETDEREEGVSCKEKEKHSEINDF